MTEVVQDLPMVNSKYPWLEWADGQPRKAVRGIDFTCEVETFRKQITRLCNRRGWIGETRRDGDAVYFTIERIL